MFDAGEDDEARYLVSELVRGRTLDRLAADGELSDRDVLRVGLALADALEHAHGRGVIHRDVKPQNVIVPDRPRSARSAAKLTDFGVAHLAGDAPLTRTGDVVGTLAYMAPEQADGHRVDERADLYSLALVLYEGLAGVNPVRAGSPAATARRLGTVLPPLQRKRKDLPAGAVRRAGPRAVAAAGGPRDARRARRRAGGGADRTSPTRAARSSRTRSSARAPLQLPPARGPGRRRRWPRRGSPRRPSTLVPGAPVDPARRGGGRRGGGRRRCRAPAGWRAAAALAFLLAPDRPGAALVLLAARGRLGRARARLGPRLVAARRRAAARAWRRSAGAYPALAGRAAALVAAGRRSAPPGCGGCCSPSRCSAARCCSAPTPPRRLGGRRRQRARRRARGRRSPPGSSRSPPCGRWRRCVLPWLVRGRYAGVDFVARLRLGRRASARAPRRSPSGRAPSEPRGPRRRGDRRGRARLAAAPPAPAGYRGATRDERSAQPGVEAGRPRRGHVLACLQVRGAPGGDRAQAHARDGGAQGPVAVAHLRAQRVRRLALARRPQAVRGLRARPRHRALGLPARARAARADRARHLAEDHLPHRRPAAAGRVRHPGAARAPGRGRRRRRRARATRATRWSTRPPSGSREPLREPDHRRGAARLRYEGKTARAAAPAAA